MRCSCSLRRYRSMRRRLELWGSLLNGAKLVVCPAGRLSLQKLGRVIQERGVTTLWLTAALFHQMVDEQIESSAGCAPIAGRGRDALRFPCAPDARGDRRGSAHQRLWPDREHHLYLLSRDDVRTAGSSRRFRLAGRSATRGSMFWMATCSRSR